MKSTLSFLRDNARWLGAGVLLTFLSSFGQTFFISIFAGEIRETFGLSHGAWGGIYTVGTTASAVVMIWAGTLTDRYRVRALGAAVLAGLACACILMAGVHAVWLLPIVIFALRFTGQGMASHIAVVAMARWFVRTRGRALSVATLGYAVGEALLPILFVALLALYDWRLLWVGAAIVALLGIPVLRTLLRQERTPGEAAETTDSAGMEGRHWTRRECLHHPLFWFMIPALLGPAAFGTAYFFHQVHFAELKGMSHLSLAATFPFYTGVSLLAMLASGWALDRFGTARLIPWYQLPLVIGFLCFSLTSSEVGILAGMFFMGLSSGANTTLPAAFWAEFYGTRHIGAIKSAAAAVMVFGSAIGPGLTGALIDFGIGLEAQYSAVATYFLFTTIMMFLGIRKSSDAIDRP